MSHKERLLEALQEEVSAGIHYGVEDWIRQVEADEVHSAKFYRWMNEVHSKSTQSGDRQYWTYVQGLMKSWKAHVRGVAIEDV